MKIARWFQGAYICGGDRGSFGGYYEDGPDIAHCLFTQAMYDRLTPEAIGQLAGVIERLFPSRTTCERCAFSPISRLIHFNNHPETTREDLDKVLAAFTEEQETA